MLAETTRMDGIWVLRNGRRLLSFCCNDYLNLTHHPAVKEAAIAALWRHGVGSGHGNDALPPFEMGAVERWAIARALAAVGGNKAEAARLLGIARRTLYARLQEQEPSQD